MTILGCCNLSSGTFSGCSSAEKNVSGWVTALEAFRILTRKDRGRLIAELALAG
jgi:hypothetical protein